MLNKQQLMIWGLLIGGSINAMEPKASEVLALGGGAHCVCAKPVTAILLSTSNASAIIKAQEHKECAKPAYYSVLKPTNVDQAELRIRGFHYHGVNTLAHDDIMLPVGSEVLIPVDKGIIVPIDTGMIIPADYNHKIADVTWHKGSPKFKINPAMACYVKASSSKTGDAVLSLHITPKSGVAHHRIDIACMGGPLHSTITCIEPVLCADATVTKIKHHYKLSLHGTEH